MAEGKKSFTAYCDWGDLFDELSDEQAGKLAKHLFDYVRDKNPEAPDPITKLLFIQIKNTLKRDLKKWEAYLKKQSDNGKKGGRPKKPKETQKTQPFSEKPKKAVSVSVSDSVSVSERDISSDDDNKKKTDTAISLEIERCKKMYLGDKRIVKAVCKNKANKITEDKIENRLTEFNAFLTSVGTHSKPFSDYCSHFLNWHKKNHTANKPTKAQYL